MTANREPRLVAARGSVSSADTAGAGFPFTAGELVRAVLFLAVFAYFWVGFEIFTDLADPKVLLLDNDGNAFRQVVTLLLVAIVGVFALHSVRDMLPGLVTPMLVAVAAWLFVAVVLSTDPGLSARRYALAMFMVGLAAVTPLIPVSERQFSFLAATALLAFLAVNFAAVVFMPNIAIHQPWDLKEANLAGGWRGLYQHKNAAGSAMASAVFLGIYIARARSMMLGLLVAGAAAAFLLFTLSKTPPLFLVPTLAVSWLVLKLRSTVARCLLLLAVVAAINLFTLGTVVFPGIKSIVEKSISDPTFTNRTDIWEFATREVMRHPVKGYGFAAFWGTTDVASSGDSIETWATKAGHAHNGYLDSVINAGFPALLLIILWLVIEPMRNLARQPAGSHGPLTTLYVQLIVFGLLMSCMESQFFAADGPIWFMMLFAVFGLKLQASADLVREADPASPGPSTGR